ncbi:MAG: FAD-dependent oxidoreductase [Oscillospiraceae bacterium]|nr:FAD-dependent oxidoreductase [Oscillospiraceae bacterium]
MNKNYPLLLSPIKLAGLTLKNRIFSAPTSLAELGPDTKYTKENLEYYKLRAAGGAAVVCVGEVIVDLANGQSHPQQIGIDDPGNSTTFCQLVDTIHSHGAAASAELDHGGALCAPEFLGKMPAGPSAYVDDWGDEVRAMTEEEILQAAKAFGQAAANAKHYGFDMVTVHAGHGWLIHQFISPLTIFRTDKWGGSIENRLRFLLLCIDEIRAAVGKNFPIEVRISGSERIEGGYDLDIGVEIAKALDGKVDLIHVSAGTQQVDYSCVKMHPGPFEHDMENRNLAAEIKKHVKTPVCSVGAYNFPEQMEDAIASGDADCIALGRALVADPFLPKKIIEGREKDIRPCLRCSDCMSSMIAFKGMRCAVNPVIGRECDAFHPLPVNQKKKVLIAGGGPAGMQAALTAVERGHQVVLCEERDKLGGALKFADNGAPNKLTMKRYRDSQIRKVMESSAEVRLNTKVTKAVVDEVQPDVLIAAVGALPVTPPIPGAKGENVIFGADLMADTPLGKNVVVIGGGMIGCEESVYLSDLGHNVTIVEMQNDIAADCLKYPFLWLHHEVEARDIRVLTSASCTEITPNSVTVRKEDGSVEQIPCDNVVMAAGTRARSDVVEELRPLCDQFYIVGDAKVAKNVMMAVRDGYDAVVDMGL